MRSKNDPGGQLHAGSGKRESPEPERSFIEKARRAQIIDAAVDTIAVRGFAKASLAQIAERAGISKGVISYHFSGKDELIEQVVEQVYEEIGVFVGARLEEQAGAAVWLRVYIESVAEYMHGHRTQLAALGEIFSHFRTADGAPRYGVASSEPLYTALEKVFLKGQEERRVPHVRRARHGRQPPGRHRQHVRVLERPPRTRTGLLRPRTRRHLRARHTRGAHRPTLNCIERGEHQ